MVIDKTLLANRLLWILSLDLSTAFDRVDWDALWRGLRLHGVSAHLVWLLQVVYSNQTGQITGHSDVSREFCIKAGVRQGCVLSPRLFCSVLQLAMEEWRCDVSHTGLDLGDGGPPLLDLRFADDILLFAGSAEQLGFLLDKLVTSLEKVGLKLNAAKTKALTTQAQPPKTLKTRAGLEIAVLDQSSSHKWLGCMLSTENAGRRQDDIDHRLQSAARAFHVHKWILCDKMVSMASRLKFLDAMITSVVCFAAGHRKIYTTDLRKLDVHFGSSSSCFSVPTSVLNAMASMTPDRPAKNRRFTSPLHEMDGNEEAAEGSPVQSESTTQELTRDVERLSVDAIARIVRSEIQDGLQPLQAQVSTLNSSMSVRMERVEGEMKSVKDKMSEQDVRIAKLETYLSNVGRETATPRSMDGDANFETRFAELKSQMDMLTTEGKGKVDTSSVTNQSCTMVVGGLLSLNSLKEATTWMADILQKLNGPTGQEMYMKTKEFQRHFVRKIWVIL